MKKDERRERHFRLERRPLEDQERLRVLAFLSVPEPGDNIVVRAMRLHAAEELARSIAELARDTVEKDD